MACVSKPISDSVTKNNPNHTRGKVKLFNTDGIITKTKSIAEIYMKNISITICNKESKVPRKFKISCRKIVLLL